MFFPDKNNRVHGEIIEKISFSLTEFGGKPAITLTVKTMCGDYNGFIESDLDAKNVNINLDDMKNSISERLTRFEISYQSEICGVSSYNTVGMGSGSAYALASMPDEQRQETLKAVLSGCAKEHLPSIDEVITHLGGIFKERFHSDLEHEVEER